MRTMTKEISPCPTLRGDVVPPGDKSISHRAVVLNSIARGTARLSNFSPAVDCGSTVACMQALGVQIRQVSSEPPTIEVEGVGNDGLREADDVLDAGNSATTMRLLSGLLAAQPFFSVVSGDDSLRSRPMDRVIEPLRRMGANIWGRGRDSLAPLAIRGGRLHGTGHALPVASAQVKSAVLIAALFAEGETTVEEPSKSRDHTERMLQAMGASLRVEGCRVSIVPMRAPLNSVGCHIPGDMSSAAYWLVAGAIHPDASIRIKDTGVNPTRAGIVEVLLKMGAKLRIENRYGAGHEPLSDLLIESSQLTGVEIGGELIPRLIDEIPVIAVAACIATGVTVIKDAGELRVKESDRISSLVGELARFGARIEERPDGMIIHGGAKLRGTRCSSHHDHRLAMALAVAALVAEGETQIEGADVVGVSYPSFWADLKAVTAN